MSQWSIKSFSSSTKAWRTFTDSLRGCGSRCFQHEARLMEQQLGKNKTKKTKLTFQKNLSPSEDVDLFLL